MLHPAHLNQWSDSLIAQHTLVHIEHRKRSQPNGRHSRRLSRNVAREGKAPSKPFWPRSRSTGQVRDVRLRFGVQVDTSLGRYAPRLDRSKSSLGISPRRELDLNNRVSGETAVGEARTNQASRQTGRQLRTFSSLPRPQIWPNSSGNVPPISLYSAVNTTGQRTAG